MGCNFQIKRGDEVLATLTNCEPVEMFWLSCDYNPTEAFAPIEALFREASESDGDMDVLDTCYSRIFSMGIVLVDSETGREYPSFALHLMPDGKADLRY